MTPRRGWRERVEPGLYRLHRVHCPRTADKRPRGRCGCPFGLVVPGSGPGATRTITHPGPIGEARDHRRALLGARRDVPEAATVETLEGFFAHYLRTVERHLAPATVYTADECYRLRIGPRLGHLPLADLTPEVVLGFANELAATATSRRLIEKTVAVLRAALSAAVEWGRIPTNPARGIRVTRLRVDAEGDRHDGERERRVLTAAELRALFTAGRGGRRPNLGMATLVRVAAEGGLRRGELVGLRWGDIDLQGRRIRVRRSVWQERHRGGRRIEKPTKGRSARTVPIGEPLARDLAAWWARSVVEAGGDAAGYVWPGRDGGPMAADTPTQYLERLQVRAGLVDDDGAPLVSLHGLRHGCGSLMLQAGVPLIAVSRFLGHATVQVTAERYSHLVAGDDQLRQASDALAGLIASNTPGTLRGTLREATGGVENGEDKQIRR